MLAVPTLNPAAAPNSSLLGTETIAMLFSLHKGAKCITISGGLISFAIITSLAVPLSTAFVTSLVPFFIFPVFLANSTASYTLLITSLGSSLTIFFYLHHWLGNKYKDNL